MSQATDHRRLSAAEPRAANGPGGAPGSGGAAGFAATRWSMVLAAGRHSQQATARRALSELCQAYWYPLYAYVRRRGLSPQDAEDLVQAFFARLLEKGDLAQADRAKGRFRSFLLAAVSHFLSNQWAHQRAAKRGGGRHILSLEGVDPESRYLSEPADNTTPDRLFDRRWALAVLEVVMARLRQEYHAAGRQELFEALKPVLTGASDATSAQLAAGLNLKPASVRVAAHRLRKRYRETLRDEISQTVASPEEIDDEIRELLACL